ncbi:MAG: heavy metal translocating P-type ATPase [Spirochaetia bacterium]
MSQCCSGNPPHIPQAHSRKVPGLTQFFVHVIILCIGLLLIRLIPEATVYGRIPYAILFFIFGWPFWVNSIKHLMKGQIFDENLLTGIAAWAAFYLQEYPEGLAIMFFARVGELFVGYAETKSVASIQSLMQMKPTTTEVYRNGEWVCIPIEKVYPGQRYKITVGDRNGVDGRVVQGTASIDTSMLTGESVPVTVQPGDQVLAGMLVQQGTLEMVALKAESESSFQRILELTKNSQLNKSFAERFITKFARIYTPSVVVLSTLVAILPILLWNENINMALTRAITLLVIACPCALIISVPLSYFTAIGRASRLGIIFKGSQFISEYPSIRHFVFDKTGTLTSGQFTVQHLFPHKTDRDNLLKLATYAAANSSHPLSRAVFEYGKAHGCANQDVMNFEEYAGYGVTCKYAGKTLLMGRQDWLKKCGINPPSDPLTEQTTIFIGYDGIYIGCISLDDEPRPHSQQLIAALHAQGIRVSMLSGDRNAVVKRIATALHIDDFKGELLPEEKLEYLGRLLENNTGKVAFVGDGINDLPSIVRADIGIAMGKGSESALEVADAVLLGNNPYTLYQARNLSQKTQRIVWQNIIFSIGIKFVVLGLAVLGLSEIWQAIFADTGATILAVLNAFRIFQFEKPIAT